MKNKQKEDGFGQFKKQLLVLPSLADCEIFNSDRKFLRQPTNVPQLPTIAGSRYLPT